MIRIPCLLGILVWLLSLPLGAQTPEPLEPPPEDPNAPKRQLLPTEDVIRFYQKRLAQDPKQTLIRTRLGAAYLRLARETDNEEHYRQAEAEFQKVLALSPKSAAARAYLASALMAQHKFREALELSQAVYRDNPRSTHALATIGDAYLELGQYEEAEHTFQKLQKTASAPLPEVLARLARLAELRGQTERAIQLLKEAREGEQSSQPDSREIAWYDLRLGEVYFNSNQMNQAEQHFEAALERREKYVPALMGLGQVRAAQGRYQEAVELYEEVISQKPDFDLIGDLATLHALAGNEAQAKALEEKAIALVPEAAKIETEARHLALFLADRELQLDLALESAQKELKVRQDIFAYDVLAWTLFKSGQTQAAWEAMQKALRLGTKDARMHFHAGMIARALGQREEARRHLSEALKINPHFSFTDPEQARKALREL